LKWELDDNKEKICEYEAILRKQSVLQTDDKGTSVREESQQQLEFQEQRYEEQLKEHDAIITKLHDDLKNVSTEK